MKEFQGVECVELNQKRQRWVIIGLFLGFISNFVMQGMVIPAIPKAIGELQGMELYSMATTVFLLTSTVFMPIAGKLGGIYGRKNFFSAGVIILSVGSFLCGIAHNIGWFIVFRGIQGIGQSFIIVNGLSLIGELFLPSDRAKYMGLYGMLVGLFGIITPSLGGVVSDVLSWRWVFFATVPLGLVALVVFVRATPKPSIIAKEKIDYLGMLLLTITTTCMILVFSWGGQLYPWSSFFIIAMILISVISLVFFIITESRVSSPIFAIQLFKSPSFVCASIGVLFITPAIYASGTYFPLYGEAVRGISTSHTGMILGAAALGMSISSYIAGMIIAKTGKIKQVLLASVLLLVIGIFGLYKMDASTSMALIVLILLIKGLGTGPFITGFTVVVQNSLPKETIGIATSMIQFIMKLGGTITLSILGLVYNYTWLKQTKNIVPEELTHTLSPEALKDIASSNILLDQVRVQTIRLQIPTALQSMYDDLMIIIKNVAAEGIHNIYFLVMIFTIITLITLLLLKNASSQKEVENPQEN